MHNSAAAVELAVSPMVAVAILISAGGLSFGQGTTGWKGTSGTSWNNALNWDNGKPSSTAKDLLFGNGFNTAGATGSTTANNDIAGFSGHRILFETTGGTDHSFTITGNGFTLSDFSTGALSYPQIANLSSLTQNFNLPTGQSIAFNSGTNTFGEIFASGTEILVFSGTTQIDLPVNSFAITPVCRRRPNHHHQRDDLYR